MVLTFLGTRANIRARNRCHRRHAAALLTYRRARLLIDCGADWLGAVARYRPSAIVITHAHPDHVDGLKRGAPCAVYASTEALATMKRWPIRHVERILPRTPISISGVVIESFPVDHSIIAPAVGYRITCGRTAVFYVPDVFGIRNRRAALEGIALYVGDGATLARPIVRHRNGVPIGHASIAAQLEWCARARVPRAVFTHCGTAIVGGGTSIRRRLQHLGVANGVNASFACDGLRLTLP